ncbi:MAG: homoserine dehydrogenase [Methanobacteriota archaeon]|nr:MAG: homoserine dehydrogenase [Euryarchaeota archaeon]
MILRLAFIGFGNVGQEFARLLLMKRKWLVSSKGVDIEVRAISTRSRGTLLSNRGLDLERVLEELKANGDLRQYGSESVDLTPLEMLDKCGADIMVELSPLNVDSGQPAVEHVSFALQSKMHVITANKGPIAFAYDRLEALAKSRNVKMRFEGTVMDGTPVFNLVEKTLQGCEILRMEGILNSTSNFVLTEMFRGRDLTDAVKEARSKGIAEADASLDLEGWDAAVKITALANVLMEAGTTPNKVDRSGIMGVKPADIDHAKEKGKRLKLVARADRTDTGVRTSVCVEEVGCESQFWSVEGTSSALILSTDLMGDITLIESNPAITQTAYAVLSDLLSIVEWMRTDGS